MQTSEAGIALIKEFEGCRLDAYQDSVGVWTIGYGHTLNVKGGDHINEDIADAFLRADLMEAERCVHNAVSVVLEQREFDSLVSFVFNLGCQNLRSSTLLRLLNMGKKEDAANQFIKWIYAGGKVLKGLERRRGAERRMFLGADNDQVDTHG